MGTFMHFVASMQAQSSECYFQNKIVLKIQARHEQKRTNVMLKS